MKKKLTLRLSEDLIDLAKRRARERGNSVSKLVANYFSIFREREKGEEDHLPDKHTAFTQSLLGCASGEGVGSGPDDHKTVYYRHLEEKHR